MTIYIDGQPFEGIGEITPEMIPADSVPENHPTVAEPAHLVTMATVCARVLAELRKEREKLLKTASAKWWHYYKHSKKVRVRMKYRRLMARYIDEVVNGLPERRNP